MTLLPSVCKHTFFLLFINYFAGRGSKQVLYRIVCNLLPFSLESTCWWKNLTSYYFNILFQSLSRGYVSRVKSHIDLLVYEIAQAPPLAPPTLDFFFLEKQSITVGQRFGDPCWSRPTVNQVCQNGWTEMFPLAALPHYVLLLLNVLHPPSLPPIKQSTHTSVGSGRGASSFTDFCLFIFIFYRLAHWEIIVDFFFSYFYNQMLGCVNLRGEGGCKYAEIMFDASLYYLLPHLTYFFYFLIFPPSCFALLFQERKDSTK